MSTPPWNCFAELRFEKAVDKLNVAFLYSFERLKEAT